MGNKGRPVTAQRPSAAGALRSAAGSFGVTSSGGIRRMQTHRRKKHARGYRMPAIVKQQIEHSMRFQDQLIIALMARGMH